MPPGQPLSKGQQSVKDFRAGKSVFDLLAVLKYIKISLGTITSHFAGPLLLLTACGEVQIACLKND
jgi:hypothetical protein